MFYTLSWLIVVALLALWSFTAWAMHAVAVWVVTSAGTLTVPDGFAPWLPLEITQWAVQLMESLAPFVDSLLQAAPALANGLTVAAWAIWGIVSVLMVLLGAALHLLIALWRRRGGSPLVAG